MELQSYEDNAVMKEGNQARYANDDKLFVKFYSRAVRNKFKSDQEGRPIFDEKDYIIIMVPGDRNTAIDQPVTEEHKHRFGKLYDLFKSNKKQAESGTPLEVWPQLTVSQVAELKYLNIFTVEALANLSDSNGQKILGFNDLRARAQAFLEAAEGEAANSKLSAELEKRDAEIASLQEQINQLIKSNAKPAAKGGVSKK